MKFQFDGYNWIIRLEKGEMLMEVLNKFILEQKIKSVWISGLGAVAWAELGYYDLKNKKYIWKKVDKQLEITGLSGNISWIDEKPILHVHGSFSDEKMQAFGGHVREFEVAGTCEILLHRWYKGSLTRSHDDATGLKLLDL